MRRGIITVAMAAATTFAVHAEEIKYKDAHAPVQERVDDLMHRMTLEEKVAQMCQYVGIEHIRESQVKWNKGKIKNNDDAHGFYKTLSANDIINLTKEGKIGSFLHVVTAKEANELQKYAQASRLQIPLIIGIDAIHGNALVNGSTVYPTPIGQAASFNLDLVKEVSEQSAIETRASGAQWTFTPNLDVARDARWGRVGETYGEDPYLVSRMGVATIKGLQGDDLSNPTKVLACAKHLIAGSEPSNGTNAAPMDVSVRTLREVFLPPYKAAIEEANVYTVMAAHNELNGIPCHASKWLMTDLIRDEYGFDGFVVSDWMDIERIYDMHHAAETLEDAFRQTVDAGMDMHMHGPEFLEGVCKLVRDGKLSEKAVDRACAKILQAKFMLGLFENPYVKESNKKKVVFTKEHQKSALELAEQSIVLLKNDNLLPVDFKKYKRILVTGPNANNHTILGDWALEQPEDNVTTILEGLQQVAGKKRINYLPYGDDVRVYDKKIINQAAAEAKQSDLAIVVVGENPLRYQNTKTCGENIDRMSLGLLGGQKELVQKIQATGTPTIVVLVGGRPLAINWIAKHVPAIVQAWEPGSFGGLAVANILGGKTVPSAKLPITIPRHAGQIQMIYNCKPSQYFHPYKDGPSTPLYPFGFGLSYTTFKYDNLTLNQANIPATGEVTASVEVKNTGDVAATEVVQLYIRDEASSATRPVKELKDFARVTLKPGESQTVRFTITPEKLAFYNREMKYGVEKGSFKIMAGGSSLDKDLISTTLNVK